MSSAAALANKTCARCGGSFGRDAVFCPIDGNKLDDPNAGAPSDSYIGSTLAGDVELRSVAGVGAMGRVYRAHQRGIDRDVAVKVLHRELSSNTQLVQRFHREAKIASKLSHPHVVEVFFAGQLPDGALYIVMEYLDGMSLASALDAAGGAFPVERAISIALQICDAVGEGHVRGIVHRDLKPENVMLVRRADVGDWVKVLDFGIAKVSLGEQSMETAAGLIFGTARYISPEGAQGTTVGPPGDVYSLATMVYQMLAGRTPFDAEQPVGLLIKHIHDAPPPLRSWPKSASVPAPIERVVMENLAKDPAQRAPNARAFGNALAGAAKQANVVLADVGVVARMSQLPAQPVRELEPTLDERVALAPPVAPPAPITRTVTDAPPPTRERKSAPLVIVLLAFLLGAAVAGLVAQHYAQRTDPERAGYITKTRHALDESHYVSPPNENVKDLVTAGLARWPGDAQLGQIRSDAAHEMVTRSMAAHSAGDVAGARDLAKNALVLLPSDHSAKILADQYDDEMQSLSTPAGRDNGVARVLFDAPARARGGDKLDVTGRVLPRSSGPHAKIAGAKVTIFDNGKTTGGRPVPVTDAGGGIWKAETISPTTGSYDVVFEVTVDGRLLRAERDLDVD